MYLGLDLAAKSAHYAATSNGGTYQQGTVTLETLPGLLDSLQPVAAVGMEYTGRLAEQWCLLCFARGLPAFILHSTLRKSLNNLHRQTAKTDKADALTICKNLRLWHDVGLRDHLGLPADLFTNAEETRTAWVLRALLADADAHKKQRTAAKLRYLSAHRVGMPERAALWLEAAKSPLPEHAISLARDYAREHFTRELDLLLGIPNVGDATALSIIAYLLPIERFEQAGKRGDDQTFRNIRRYCGLHPIKNQTGTTRDEEHEPVRRGCRPLRGALALCSRSAAHPNRTDPFARLYRSHVSKGMKPGKAVGRVATALLRVSVAILRSGRPFHDPLHPHAPPPEPLPAHLLTQSEAARQLGTSRQRVHQLVTTGKLRTEEHDGKTYVIAKYLDAALLTRRSNQTVV